MPKSFAMPQPIAPSTVRHVRFVAEQPEGAKVLRTFAAPRSVWAIEEETSEDASGHATREQITAPSSPGKPDDRLILSWMPRQAPAGPKRAAREEDKVIAVAEDDHTSITLRPGTALTRCEPADREAVEAAVIDLAFLEGELRALESFLLEGERWAVADLAPAHRIEQLDLAGREAMLRKQEKVTGARLTFARLEPQFATRTRDLRAAGRRWFLRLRRAGKIFDRLEATSDRLEALEDFYEAATQRISDYRWYKEGHRLEKGIVGLLLLECSFMVADIVLHLLR